MLQSKYLSRAEDEGATVGVQVGQPQASPHFKNKTCSDSEWNSVPTTECTHREADTFVVGVKDHHVSRAELLSNVDQASHDAIRANFSNNYGHSCTNLNSLMVSQIKHEEGDTNSKLLDTRTNTQVANGALLGNRDSLNRDSEKTRTRKKKEKITILNDFIDKLQLSKDGGRNTTLTNAEIRSAINQKLLETNSSAFCSICYLNWEHDNPSGKLNCGHGFCFECIHRWSNQSNHCPLCKEKFFSITHQTEDGKLVEQIPVMEPVSILEREEGEVMQGIEEESSSLTEPSPDPRLETADDYCYACKLKEEQDVLLVCDHCSKKGCHIFCLRPPLRIIPDAPWYCDYCVHRFNIRSTLPTAKIIRQRKQPTGRKAKGKKAAKGKVSGPFALRTPIPGRGVPATAKSVTQTADTIEAEITSDEEFQEEDLDSDESEEVAGLVEEGEEEEGSGSESEDYSNCDDSSEEDSFIVVDQQIEEVKPGEGHSKARLRLRKSAELVKIAKLRHNQRVVATKKCMSSRLKENCYRERRGQKSLDLVDLERANTRSWSSSLRSLTRTKNAFLRAKRGLRNLEPSRKLVRLRKGGRAVVKRRIFGQEDSDCEETVESQRILTRRMKQSAGQSQGSGSGAGRRSHHTVATR